MTGQRLVFVGERCDGHSPSSGYHQLCSLFPDADWLRAIGPDGDVLSWYRQVDQAATPDVLFHVLYADSRGGTLAPRLRARFPASTIVSSIHQPIDRLAPDVLTSLARSDALLTVTRHQARDLTATPPTFGVPVHVAAHGVWVDTFRPPRTVSQDDTPFVLLVGNTLRDWPAARVVSTMLGEAGVRTIVVGERGFAPRGILDGLALVDVRDRLPEAELVRLYHRAVALFLPLLDATASNAALEAMAAGCPVVSSRVPSLVDEYLGDDVDAFERGRDDVAVAHLLGYARSPARRAARSQVLLERVQRFDWARLAPDYVRIYESLRTATAGWSTSAGVLS